ncbi:MAG TPA: hypothetical protein VJZ26_10440, partial [Blastocatellia bacterium]|nr:hypothetical protein [Blastocatellia bacterium]
FDRFLSWLHSNREEAGKEYEKIRHELIRSFTSRGCADAEDLADITFNRVIKKVAKIADSYVGERAPYFAGVAYYVRLEVFKKPSAALPMPELDPPEEKEKRHECLEQCLSRLAHDRRQRVLQYYCGEKKVKKEYRKNLAREMGIELNALRIQMHRIRASLRECMTACLKKYGVE